MHCQDVYRLSSSNMNILTRGRGVSSVELEGREDAMIGPNLRMTKIYLEEET